MTHDLVIYGVPSLIALVAGGGAGAFTSWRLSHREPVAELATVEPDPERDPFIDAEIDIAAIDFAEAHALPPHAAGLIAARLRSLHDIGKEKGWL